MFIWRNQTLVHIVVSKPFINPIEFFFMIELIIKLQESSSYLAMM